MPNAVVRNIPNTITCCNLFCGCIACYMAFKSEYELALLFIVSGAVFDFFDGMTARMLHVSSPIGKELDSLADDITFGLAPAAIAFSLFKEVNCPEFLPPLFSLSDSRVFGIEAGKIQPRRAADQFVYRHANPGERTVLGFIGSGSAQLPYRILFQRRLFVRISRRDVAAACGRTSDVFAEI